MKYKMITIIILGFLIAGLSHFKEVKSAGWVEQTNLCRIAELRLAEIQSDWSHNGFWKYTKNSSYNAMGENLARGYKDKHSLYRAWFNSPPHRKNLEKHWKYSCLRCENTYCVQEFAEIIK